MVTRFIEKDKPTQVNSDKIGVQVVTTETGEIACQVSYSIKGDVFTTVTPTLTDENNVICNIPRYVYLKFSQDVEITEE